MAKHALIRVSTALLGELLQLPAEMTVVRVHVDRGPTAYQRFAADPDGYANPADRLLLTVTHPDLYDIATAVDRPELELVYETVRAARLVRIDGMPRWLSSGGRR